MGESGHEQFIKEVVASTIGKCSTCEHPYDVGSVSVLGHQDELWFLSVVCGQCQTRGLVAVLIKEQTRPQAIGGLSGEEGRWLADEPSVSAGDVLAIHQFLAGFDGDFKGLFGQSSQSG